MTERRRRCRRGSKHLVRPKTLNVRRLLCCDIERLMDVSSRHDYWRPQTRADCESVERPCLYVACRYNLYCDVTVDGNIRLNFPDLEPGDMVESCALDMAERGECTLDTVGEVMNMSAERVRQIEERVLGRFNCDVEESDE